MNAVFRITVEDGAEWHSSGAWHVRHMAGDHNEALTETAEQRAHLLPPGVWKCSITIDGGKTLARAERAE